MTIMPDKARSVFAEALSLSNCELLGLSSRRALRHLSAAAQRDEAKLPSLVSLVSRLREEVKTS